MGSSEHDLARSSLTLIADHHDVVAGALQKPRKPLARRAGTVGAKNPLVGAQSLHLGAGGGGYIAQNLLQAGVGSLDAQTLAVPCDRGLAGLLVGRPLGELRRW